MAKTCFKQHFLSRLSHKVGRLLSSLVLLCKFTNVSKWTGTLRGRQVYQSLKLQILVSPALNVVCMFVFLFVCFVLFSPGLPLEVRYRQSHLRWLTISRSFFDIP